MNIVTDFHNHISYTSAHEMMKAARAKGLRTLGLSEHVFQMREGRTSLQHLPREGRLLSFAAYIEEVQAAARKAQFDARLGLEVDFIPGKNDVIQASIQSYPWDFLIGSVHEVDGVLLEDENAWTEDAGQRSWLRYFELLREAVKSRYFSVISHPVRMRMLNPHLPPTFDDELERLAAEAARYDVALEVNGYDVLTYPDAVRRLAKACALQRAPVSAGSDSHWPREIARAQPATETILREAGISKIRTWRQREIEE